MAWQRGRFTTAARALDLSKAPVSRKVAALEDRLGARPLKRSTRRLGLFEAGRTLFEECAPLLHGTEQTEASIADRAAQPSRRIAITAPA